MRRMPDVGRFIQLEMAKVTAESTGNFLLGQPATRMGRDFFHTCMKLQMWAFGIAGA
jgi:hypothetical protein